MRQVLIKNKRSRKVISGFSLIEVVVAVGIFAIAIVSVIGLLGPINKTVSEVKDFDDASRVVAAIQSQLQTSYEFDEVIDFFGQKIYASRDGSKVGSDEEGGADWQNNAEKFFAVTIIRNTELSPEDNDGTAGYLAFTIKLQWPEYTPGGNKVDAGQQSVMIVPAAITR